jgi:hypothetical protein
MRNLLLLSLLMLVGCASPKPYFEIGLGVRDSKRADTLFDPDLYDWNCEDPTAEIEIGVRGRLRDDSPWYTEVNIHHWSHVSCGGPVGRGKPELHDLRYRAIIGREWSLGD